MHAIEGGRPILVGRDGEIARLIDLAERARQGSGGLVVIEGEAGVGKSTLLAAVGAELERRGMRVLLGTAEELDRRIPFAAISTCWAAQSDEGTEKVSSLLRGEGSSNLVGAEYTEYAVLECVLALVERWCAGTPVALVLDDLQWADPATLVVLNRLIRMSSQLPLLLVLAHRPVHPGEEAARLLHVRQRTAIRLAPLSGDAVARLVEQTLRACPDETLLGLLAVTAGNPLYVTTLLDSLVQEGRIVVEGAVATVTGETSELPSSLTAVITRQLDFLSIRTRKVLHVAALIGPTFDAAELSTMLGMTALELLEVSEHAIHVGLISGDGPQLAFRHELIRRVLHDEVVPSVRAALHLQAGHALAAAGAPVERVASHFVSAGFLGTVTVEWLVGVAESLTVRAPELAVILIGRAVERLDAGDPKRRTLLVTRARSLLWAGELTEALSSAQQAIPGIGDPAAECELRWVLVQANWRLGRLERAAEEARAAEPVAATVSRDWADRYRGLVAHCLFLSGRIADAEVIAEEVLETAADLRGQSYARLALCMIRLNEGQAAEALGLAERLLADLGRESGRPDLQIAPHIGLARAYLQLDRLADAEKAFELGRQLEERHAGMHLALYHSGKGLATFWQGHWDDTLAEVTASADIGDSTGLNQNNAALARLIELHRHGPNGLPAEEPNANIGGFYYLLFHAWGEALVQEGRAEPESALELLAGTWEKLGKGYGSYDRMWLCPDLARLAALCGRSDLLAAMLDDLGTRVETPNVRGTKALCAAYASGDAALAATAAEEFRQAGRPLFEGYAHEHAAVLLARAADVVEARARFEQARQLYLQLDAAWDVSRAEARLRQEGVRPGVQGRRQRPKSGWAALTNAEHKVAALVGQGCSNPDIATQLFLSRRTVQAHVSSIFTKLGLSTRVELAVLVSARQSDS